MDININVKIDCPNIVNAVLALAEALEQMKAEVQINAGLQSTPKEVQAPKENFQSNEKSKTPTLEEVRTVLAKLSQKGKQQEVKTLINKFGAKKLTEISKDKYEELLKEAAKIEEE